MIPEQVFHPVTPATLVDEARKMRDRTMRLVQICATVVGEELDVVYSFADRTAFEHLQLRIPRQGGELPSITGIYFGAFGYENELHDLFGIAVKDIAVSYNGSFYKIATATPFNLPTPATNPTTPVSKNG